MTALLSVLAMVAAVFLISATLSYGFTTLARRRRAVVVPEENAVLRLRGPSGMYRCRLLRVGRDGWWVTSPLSRNAPIPLRIGENLSVEMGTPGGAILFDTRILDRDPVQHALKLDRPKKASRIERRAEARDRRWAGRPCLVDGERGEIVDTSPRGVRLVTGLGLAKGDEVRIRMPDDSLACGWVLETEPAAFGDRQGSQVRVLLA
jgi:hypothetical protein